MSIKNTHSKLRKKIVILGSLAGVLVILIIITLLLLTPKKDISVENNPSEDTSKLDDQPKVKVSSYNNDPAQQLVTYTLSNGTSDSITYGKESDAITEFASEIDIRVADVNFDGNDDLLLSYTTGAYNMETHIKVYDQTLDRLIAVDRKSDFLGAEPEGYITVDNDQKTLSTLMKFRGIGDIYAVQVYGYGSGHWSLTEVTVQDEYVAEAGQRVQGYYERTISSYENAVKIDERQEYYRYNDETQKYQKTTKAEIE